MAAVTLKDLMDPLTKIEKSAEQTNAKLDALIEMQTAGSGGGGLEQAIVDQLSAQTTLLQLIEKNTQGGTGLSSLFSRSKPDKKAAATAGETLNLLGVGAKSTATGMLLWMLVPKKTITKFTMFVQDSFEALANSDPKKAKEGIEVLDLMGGAILKFSKALALSALLLIPGMLAMPFLLASIVVMGGAMALLGAMSKRINKGSKALDRMGDAIKSFGIGLALFAVSTMFILLVPQVLIGMVATLLLIGGAVALIGGKKMSKRIRKGSLGLLILGVALIPFALGVLALSFATKGNSIGDVLIQGATILAIGASAALVGKFNCGTCVSIVVLILMYKLYPIR